MSLISGLLKFTVGTAIGAAVGAGVAAILAPKRGEEMQDSIKQRIEDSKRARAEAEERKREEMKQAFREMVNDPSAFREGTVNGTISETRA